MSSLVEQVEKMFLLPCRSDLILFLHNGPGNLTFFVDPVCEPLWVCPHLGDCGSPSLPTCLNGLDPDLILLSCILKAFCNEANTAVHLGKKLSEALYMETMVCIMYRLAKMAFDEGSIDEALRLGLLALVSISDFEVVHR